jgi:hypothetical protein
MASYAHQVVSMPLSDIGFGQVSIQLAHGKERVRERVVGGVNGVRPKQVAAISTETSRCHFN